MCIRDSSIVVPATRDTITPGKVVLCQLTCARLSNLAKPVPAEILACVHVRGHYEIMVGVSAGNGVDALGSCTGESETN